MSRGRTALRLLMAGSLAVAGVFLLLPLAWFAARGVAIASIVAAGAIGAAAGWWLGASLYDQIAPFVREAADRWRAEVREWKELAAAVRAMSVEDARRSAEPLLERAEPNDGPLPDEVASLPCLAGELFARYRSVCFGPFQDSLGIGEVAPLPIAGRRLVRIGSCEGGDIAVDPERRVAIYGVGKTYKPDAMPEFPTVYHLIAFYGRPIERKRAGRCPRCRYPSAGLSAARLGVPPAAVERITCPECGWTQTVALANA